MTYSLLVTHQTLADHLDDPQWVIVDCSFDLNEAERGEQQYLQGHIRGAVYAHLERDLSAPLDGTNGRHPLPSRDELVEVFSRLGIGPGMQVVGYDSSGGPFASRLWWCLHLLGHASAAVLDGGFQAWSKAGLPVAAGAESRPRANFQPGASAWETVQAADILERMGQGVDLLIDARAPERYRGDVEPLDPVAGHIPGAANFFWESALGQDGQFRPADELREEFLALLKDHSPSDAILYCGSGVTAAHLQLSMLHAGLSGMRLYPGSWSEWCAAPARPVETGEPSKPG